MSDPTLPNHPKGPTEADPSSNEPRGLLPVPEFDEQRFQLQCPSDAAPGIVARAGRRGTRDKFVAGVRGLKHAIRGDSSFFAHFYRGAMIVIIAALLGVNQWGWCLLILGGSLVLL